MLERHLIQFSFILLVFERINTDHDQVWNYIHKLNKLRYRDNLRAY